MGNKLPRQQVVIKINENIYHKTYSYKVLWNIIKFYAEIRSNFKVTLKSPAEENRAKICYSSQVCQIIITLLAKKYMGASNNKIWFLNVIAIKKARLETTYSNNEFFSWSFFKRQKDWD